MQQHVRLELLDDSDPRSNLPVCTLYLADPVDLEPQQPRTLDCLTVIWFKFSRLARSTRIPVTVPRHQRPSIFRKTDHRDPPRRAVEFGPRRRNPDMWLSEKLRSFDGEADHICFGGLVAETNWASLQEARLALLSESEGGGGGSKC